MDHLRILRNSNISLSWIRVQTCSDQYFDADITSSAVFCILFTCCIFAEVHIFSGVNCDKICGKVSEYLDITMKWRTGYCTTVIPSHRHLLFNTVLFHQQHIALFLFIKILIKMPQLHRHAYIWLQLMSYLLITRFLWQTHTHKEIVQQFIALFQMKEISNSTIYHFKFETEVYMWNKKEELHWFVMIHRKQFWSSLFQVLSTWKQVNQWVCNSFAPSMLLRFSKTV